MSAFFDRLKEERKNLNLNQDDFANLGGVKSNAQRNYEKGERKPDIDYLIKLHNAGVDTNYIITGERHHNFLTHDESYFIAKIRDASSEIRTLIVTMLSGIKTKSTESDDVNASTTVGGDLVNKPKKNKTTVNKNNSIVVNGDGNKVAGANINDK